MTLQPARDIDFEQISDWIKDQQACTRWSGLKECFPFVNKDLPSLLQKPGAVSLVLSNEQDKPLGFAQYWPRDEQRTHLGRIIVNPDQRGLGIGKILCEQLITAASEATGTPIISLRVYRDNHTAYQLYQRLGFEVREDDSSPEVLAMEKRLAV
ncbi:GNAT family N-acetyltransferase [Undibacterium sp. Dicai25W]|uniref:GNAT family N-acetyltransferase n=1 Tax=Undibacterium sp. Dicai25W TaxID=3413034 RepID=UPI003BF193E1